MILGDVQYLRHLFADHIVVGNVTLEPAALVSQLDDGKQHILDGGGIVLHRKASVAVGVYPLGQHAYGGGSGLPRGGCDNVVQPCEHIPVINSYKAGGLLVAARRRGEPRFHNGDKILSRYGLGLILPAVAVAGGDSFQNVHKAFLLYLIFLWIDYTTSSGGSQ